MSAPSRHGLGTPCVEISLARHSHGENAMRRIVRGKPLLVVTAAAAASAIAGCSTAPIPVDASRVSGNLSALDVGAPDAGAPDSSVVSGNLSLDAGPPPDAGNADASTVSGNLAATFDAGRDGG